MMTVNRFTFFKNLFNKERSIFFITLHKAASSLFASYVLKNVPGYKHVDYETNIFFGKKDKALAFEKNNHVYGPVRLVADENADTYEIVAQIIKNGFINDKKCIFMTRDPRDIIVSSYYSFGYSHQLSTDEKIKEKQLKSREKIQQMGIDDFSTWNAAAVAKRFELMSQLIDRCKDYVLLKYEDMVADYEQFYNDLSTFLPLKNEVKQKLFNLSRPKETEDISQHKRSGKIAGYREKLKGETITEMSRLLGDILSKFNYND